MLPVLHWKQILMQNHRRTDRICYDTVGCFDVPHKRSPLMRPPESPEIIDTKFFLFRRNIKFAKPQLLRYEDKGVLLDQSKFNFTQPVKVIIHGYMGRWNEQGALESVDAYLKICNCNVILVDWENGAKGPQYMNAAANTEVVGRQLGLLLLRMINKCLKPQHVHLIGFSLGAHVAGCASELLKRKGFLIGRITGLDAASPLFRHSNFKEKSKKLDRKDAIFVDAIHTDASPFFTDGFGLLEPFGHVDFFPNGGFEQPGCIDGKASVVKSHFEGVLSRELACSHLRAWQLFKETLKMKAFRTSDCRFVAFKCTGGSMSFQRGYCFPQIDIAGRSALTLDPSYRTDLGELGEDVKGEGVMYLATKGSSPYCGTQLQASLFMSPKNQNAMGTVKVQLRHGNSTADFHIRYNNSAREINGLSTIDYVGVNFNVQFMLAHLMYVQDVDEEINDTDPIVNVCLDRIMMRDMYGHSWQYCKKDLLLQHLHLTTVQLSKEEC